MSATVIALDDARPERRNRRRQRLAARLAADVAALEHAADTIQRESAALVARGEHLLARLARLETAAAPSPAGARTRATAPIAALAAHTSVGHARVADPTRRTAA